MIQNLCVTVVMDVVFDTPVAALNVVYMLGTCLSEMVL